MAVLNHVLLIGRLVADPELKSTGQGTEVCNFRIAVDRAYKNAAGEYEADFFNIVAWEQRATFVNQFFGKGKWIGIEGELQQRNFETREGEKRSVVEVRANHVSFIGPKENGDAAPSRREREFDDDDEPTRAPGRGPSRGEGRGEGRGPARGAPDERDRPRRQPEEGRSGRRGRSEYDFDTDQ